MANKKQHPNLIKVRGADALRRVTNQLEKQGFTPAPMPNDFGRTNKGGQALGGTWEEYVHSRLLDCSSDKMYPTMHLSSGGEVPVKGGTENLGYMAWGADNRNPKHVSLLSEASPYTASAHRFNTDLCAGKGPRPVYSYVQYVGGNITEKRIPYQNAGVLIKGWLRDLRRELQKEDQFEGEDNLLADDLKEQIKLLEKEYKDWEATNLELFGNPSEGKMGFMQRNNLHLTYISLTEDMQQQNLCFPELILNKRQTDNNGQNVPTSAWYPKITGLRYRMAHICRLERKDANGRINYVYISNQWLDEPNIILKQEDLKIDAIPALDPQAPVTDLERIIRQTRADNGSIRRRPTRFIIPVSYPSAGRPYYPVPSWQSIFSGDIYEYVMTMISDRNKRRKNSNVIGRIIYLNNEYMERLYFQKKADTNDDKLKVFNELREQINSFLEDRNNMGKPLVAYTFVGADGKVYESWKIVEIEAADKGTAEANQTELAEVSSIIFFAFGLDSQLVGNTPGTTTRSGGTDLRERYLLKQVQMSPMQQLLLLPLYVMKHFNHLDAHLEWEIPREVLTTLDNSKTGIATQPQEV